MRKEFFQRYASTIKKKSFRIEDWEAQRSKLMKDKELCEDWLDHASHFPHQWSWFKLAQQYKSQTLISTAKRLEASQICTHFH